MLVNGDVLLVFCPFQMPIVVLKDPLAEDSFLPESSRRPEKSEGKASCVDPLEFQLAKHLTHGVSDLREGLGRLPTELESISSLLLFNTQENPYKKYVSLDNLAGKEVEAPAKDKASLADAPTTLGEGDQLPQVDQIPQQQFAAVHLMNHASYPARWAL